MNRTISRTTCQAQVSRRYRTGRGKYSETHIRMFPFFSKTHRLTNSGSPMRITLSLIVSLLLLTPTARSAAISSVSLDGDWHFLADPDGALDVQKLATAIGVRPTRIPSSWQSQFADLADYAGAAWYWRSITLDPPSADQVALLHFGAVDYAAEVFVNGRKAGSHEGGYLPFEIDVTSLLRLGENQVAVRVV